VYHITQNQYGQYTFRETREDVKTPEFNEYGNPTDPRRRRRLSATAESLEENSFSVKVKKMTE